ncbi:hypothetical protein AQJ46_48045 [Streptomyces canus]|uniref:Secreted protein n=1 Tax=Streptomyces canus TaxID=58343 RepID=A0A124HV48_9ACTN|nr:MULTISPECIES: hypothetical protein [Streptomyces]KUN57246.1 hypothetical protein AQJ46_48045 [Streptomyces canus]MDI5903536.1 hypothetical protein [Streptomyces sp. 12257]
MTTAPRSPRLLLLSTVMLAMAGVALLGGPGPQPGPPPTAQTATDRPSAATVPSAGKPTAGTAVSATSAASTPSAVESALPPHGEGVAGDPAIQRNLEAAWPADLPAGDERELLAAGRTLLRADTTGVGRAKWPELFPDSGRQAVAPAFATARFRIQAAIARRDGSPDKAVVHLVWAGMDRGGTFTDLRITDWVFTRTIKKATATWTPRPRT